MDLFTSITCVVLKPIIDWNDFDNLGMKVKYSAFWSYTV